MPDRHWPAFQQSQQGQQARHRAAEHETAATGSIGAAAQPAWLLMFLSGKECTLLFGRRHTSLAYSLAARSFQDSAAPAFGPVTFLVFMRTGCPRRLGRSPGPAARRLATKAAPGNSLQCSRILTERTETTGLTSLPLTARCIKETDARRQESEA